MADSEWRGTKAQRDALRAKYDGHCAYCGTVMEKMHADHVKPVIRITADPYGRPLPLEERRLINPDHNVVSNMLPACAPCNLHKGGNTLEQWRDILQRSADILRRDTSTFRAGERFGVILATRQRVKFYFEDEQQQVASA